MTRPLTSGDPRPDVVRLDLSPGGDASLAGLTHLLWWRTSVTAVLVSCGETSSGAAVDVGDVRRAIELSGSDARLVVLDDDHRQVPVAP